MIQGGDIAKGDGTGTTSIYNGEAFEDENLSWREMDAAGLVASANSGKHTNGSQFFITLEPCEHLNGKHTIFGRLVSGEETLRRISQVAVDKNDRPIEPVLVARCGELERKKKQKHDSIHEVPTQVHADERGRRRKSHSSGDEMDTTPNQRPTNGRRSRRQSDNVVDEGLRGRPRLRSVSPSPSHPIEEESETMTDSAEHSPVKKHKRKRSPSPSRRLDRRDEDSQFERRRRSLPNQYDRHGRRDPEGDRYRPSPRRDDNYRYSGGHRRDQDRYRPSRDRERYQDENRLSDGRPGGAGGHDDVQPPVKFKGRGVMKYREPGRL